MNYKAIIFDMDGTIIDTNHIWKQATREIFSSRGITLDLEQENEIELKNCGLGLNQSCKNLKEIGNLPDSIEYLILEKSRRACALYGEGICFIEGFENFHAQIVTKNLKYGIATNADDDTLRITKERLNLEGFFGQHLYNISHVNWLGKPNPAIYLHAAAQLGVDPKYCIAIEDSSHGVQAAKAAGMFCIGINTAKNAALLHKADIIIEGYHEIDLDALLGIKKLA